MKSRTLSHIFKPVALSAAITAALIFGYNSFAHHDIHPISEASAVPLTSSIARTSMALPDFADIAAQQGAAVVNISVSGTVKTALSGAPQINPNDPLYEFFRRFQPPGPQNGMPTHGMGSGFIVSADGVILTNAHVVDDADEVTVKLIDKREFKAKVIGLDKLSDVAVLKIKASDLPIVKIGNLQETRVGDWVIAIGSPYGFENSVTAGIISAKSRSLPDDGYVPFLQTDVAVNPGNSGGPLFNLNGEVIGINSQIFSRTGGYQGLSFAIPIDVAMKVEKQLVDHGKVSRGRLGITIQEINQELADTFGLSKPAGALVNTVEDGSPAEKAGLEAGDVVLKFNGKEISRSAELPQLVTDVVPGTSAKLEVWHKGKSKEITLNVGEMKTAEAKTDSNSSAAKGKLGLGVRPLTAEERKQAEVSGGLLVEDTQNGPAMRAGIRPGDVILSVNGEKTNSVEELRSSISKHDKRIALLILRGEQRIFVPLNLG